MAQKLQKLSQNAQYLTAFDIIQLKKKYLFVCETNRLACFIPIWVPNSKTNTKYFWIIFLNQIIRPIILIILLNCLLQYLSQDREMSDHEEVELLLEGYRSDMQEIHLELRSMRTQIDDTR